MNHITRLALVAAITAAIGGCTHSQSRLDKITNKAPGASAEATPASKIEHTGTVEERLARLEDAYNKNAEALDFLNQVYAQQKAQQQAQEREEAAPDAMFAVAVADAVKAGQVDGPASAPVTIVKAFDFACPYCQRVAGTMEELVKEYRGKVRVVYANMLVHPPAKPAHLASCAAAKQGKYNQFKHAFWDKGFLPYAQNRDESKLGEDNILAIAKDLGLDTARLKADMSSAECEARIQADMAELSRFHVNATPTFFINGKHIDGALPKEQFKKIIDEQLEAVEASGVPGAEYYDKVVLAKGEKQFRSKLDPKPN
ncbi:MAG TPA: thioredoxin domain-containing protein [Kofleriaceae bacterium]|nr:thioredoxin domain-containing protein [Kofleriaceae bacterium]